MSATHLLNVTPEAAKWRDLSPKAQHCEKRIKIALIVSGIVLLVGTAISIYYLSKLNLVSYYRGKIINESVVPFQVMTGLFGGGVAIGLFAVPIFYNKEKCKRGSNKVDFSDLLTLNTHLYGLKTKSLDTVYSHYRKGWKRIGSDYSHYRKVWKEIGLGPLVRAGMLTVDEGDRMRMLFKDYKNELAVSDRFAKSTILKKAIEERPDTVLGYQRNVRAMEDLEGQWETLQLEIQQKFKPEVG